jgi:uncharacterized cupin superfamily protein
MHAVNIYEAQFTYEGTEPEGFDSGEAYGLRGAGGQALNVRLYEARPGQALCPYHYEYEEEWLLVLEGTATLRTPDGDRPAPRGALMCFPAGPAGAHRVANAGAETVLALMWSSAREPSVSVYPDSDKMGVWAGEDHVLLRRSDGNVGYYEGE